MRLTVAAPAAAAVESAWQPPPWLIPVLAVGSAALLLGILLLLWFCCCRRSKSASASGPDGSPLSPSASASSAGGPSAAAAAAAAISLSAAMPPLGPPALVERPVQPALSTSGTGHSKGSGRRPGKGLLGSRRGSNASLTISLGSPQQQRQPCAQPSPALAERAVERDLLKSLSRPLTASDLLREYPSPQALFKEFWDVPMHHATRCELPEGAAPKNRYATIVPNADTRVTIRQDEYINANFLRGALGAEKCFIATQGPLADTVSDFWQMVWEQRPSAIVMLTDLVERERPKCHLYFPLHCGDRMRHGQLETALLELEDCPGGYQRRLLRLSLWQHQASSEAAPRDPELQLLPPADSLTLQHFWFRSWPDHLSPDSAAALLSLAERCLELRPPAVVHCSAGLGRTGTFCAICVCVRQLRETGGCDCLATVCQLRLDRGGMVDSHEQYEFVHRALKLYVETRLLEMGSGSE